MKNKFLKTGFLGFTLIEILVVITILGILAMVGLANYSGSLVRARDAQRKDNLYQVKQALRLYYNDNQTYPLDDGSGKINSGCLSTPCQWGSSQFGTTTIYMSKLPKDPKNVDYYYDQINDDSFSLCACLENKTDDQGIDCSYPAVVSCPDCPSDWCFKLTEQ